MENHETAHDPLESLNAEGFSPGSAVIYALHGKCNVLGIEEKQVSGQSMSFYKLEIVKPALSRSTRPEPAIWLPVASARERGLRRPTGKDQVETVLSILQSREYYFSATDSWAIVQPKLEAVIRAEGAVGLAKVVSYLYVIKRRLVVAPGEILRFQETVNKLLLRELSEATGEQIRSLEDRISKGMRHKLLPDS